MKKDIHQISAPRKTVSKYYTLYGKHSKMEDSFPAINYYDEDNTYAIWHTTTDENGAVHHRFLIRSKPGGKLYNPLESYAPRFHVEGFVEHNAFVMVSKQCFTEYLQFLKTKNEAYLRAAELLIE